MSPSATIDRNNSIPILKILQALVLATIAGAICDALGVPVGWLVGPLAIGVALALIEGHARPLPSAFLHIGQAIIGVSSAARFSPDTLALASHFFVPLLLCISVTAGLSMMNGLVLWRWAGVERNTSFLGTIPGSASNIVAMSADLGAQPVPVAVLQYTRAMLVVLLMPSVANWLAKANGIEVTSNLTSVAATSARVATGQPLWANLLFLVGCASAGIFFGRLLRLPASAFIGSFLLSLAVSWQFPGQFYVPQFAFVGALLLLGIFVGLRFDLPTIGQLRQAVVIEIGLIAILILGCLTTGYIFHLVTDVDIMTALLGFVPGAIEAMVATTTQLGGDTGTVIAIQMTRHIIILLVVNVLYYFAHRHASQS